MGGRFRFSLQMTRIVDRRSWQSSARRAEDLGYDLVVTADHVTNCAPPFVALAAAAQATDSLRLGTLVANNDLRHPSMLVREAVAVDILSDGRFELGIGAGYASEEYQRIGLRFDTADVRIDRMAEAARLIRSLLDGEVVTRTGTHYELNGESCLPRPAQRSLPMLIGGSSKPVLEVAAGLADTVGIASTGRRRRADFVDRQIGWVTNALAATGRRPELQLLLQTVLVSDAPLASLRPTAAARLPDLKEEEVLESPYVLVGSPTTIAETILARRERWGITHYTVRFDSMHSFAPVVALLR